MMVQARDDTGRSTYQIVCNGCGQPCGEPVQRMTAASIAMWEAGWYTITLSGHGYAHLCLSCKPASVAEKVEHRKRELGIG